MIQKFFNLEIKTKDKKYLIDDWNLVINVDKKNVKIYFSKVII